MNQYHNPSAYFAGLGLLASLSSFAQVDLEAGLVAYYPFSGSANDASTNANHGTVMGAQLTTDRFGALDAAYLFNGSTDYIAVPASASLDAPDTALSMSAWVLLNGSSLTGQAGVDPILMKSDGSANAFMYRFDCGPTYVSCGSGSWFNLAPQSATIELGSWYLFTVSMSPDTVRIHINDQLLAATAYTPQLVADGRPLEIGRDMPGIIEHFNGKIDEVRIYDRAINGDEVVALYGFATSVESLPVRYEPIIIAVPGGVRVVTRGIACSARVFDPSGRAIAAQTSTGTDGMMLSVPSTGLYVVNCSTTHGAFSRKLFVER